MQQGRIDLEHDGVGDLTRDVNRRYTRGLRPMNNSANADQVNRRPGEAVAGWEAEAAVVQANNPSSVPTKPMEGAPSRAAFTAPPASNPNVIPYPRKVFPGQQQETFMVPPTRPDFGMNRPYRMDLEQFGSAGNPTETARYRAHFDLNSADKEVAGQLPAFVQSNPAAREAGTTRKTAGSLKSLVQQAANADALYNDGKEGSGQNGRNAIFTGVYKDPYTGFEYDMYEDDFPAPDGDYRQRTSGAQRRFDQMFGDKGGPASLKRTRQKELKAEEPVPDVPLQDINDYTRGVIDRQVRLATLFTHKDERPVRDAQGYSQLQERRPVGKIGLNDAFRVLPEPDAVWGETQAIGQTGHGTATQTTGPRMRESVRSFKNKAFQRRGLGTTMGVKAQGGSAYQGSAHTRHNRNGSPVVTWNHGVGSAAAQASRSGDQFEPTRHNRNGAPVVGWNHGVGSAEAQASRAGDQFEPTRHNRNDTPVIATTRYNGSRPSSGQKSRADHYGVGQRTNDVNVQAIGQSLASAKVVGLSAPRARDEGGRRESRRPDWHMESQMLSARMSKSISAQNGEGLYQRPTKAALNPRNEFRHDRLRNRWTSPSRAPNGQESAFRMDYESIVTSNFDNKGNVPNRPTSPSAASVGHGARMKNPVNLLERDRNPDNVRPRQTNGASANKVFTYSLNLDYANNGRQMKEQVGTLSPVNDPFRF